MWGPFFNQRSLKLLSCEKSAGCGWAVFEMKYQLANSIAHGGPEIRSPLARTFPPSERSIQKP